MRYKRSATEFYRDDNNSNGLKSFLGEIYDGSTVYDRLPQFSCSFDLQHLDVEDKSTVGWNAWK